MTIRSALKLLLGFALGLPLIQTLLIWVAGLLAAMGDESAATCIGRVNVGIGVLWLVGLVGLIVLLALQAVNEPHDSRDEVDEPPM